MWENSYFICIFQTWYKYSWNLMSCTIENVWFSDISVWCKRIPDNTDISIVDETLSVDATLTEVGLSGLPLPISCLDGRLVRKIGNSVDLLCLLFHTIFETGTYCNVQSELSCGLLLSCLSLLYDGIIRLYHSIKTVWIVSYAEIYHHKSLQIMVV